MDPSQPPHSCGGSLAGPGHLRRAGVAARRPYRRRTVGRARPAVQQTSRARPTSFVFSMSRLGAIPVAAGCAVLRRAAECATSARGALRGGSRGLPRKKRRFLDRRRLCCRGNSLRQWPGTSRRPRRPRRNAHGASPTASLSRSAATRSMRRAARFARSYVVRQTRVVMRGRRLLGARCFAFVARLATRVLRGDRSARRASDRSQ